MINGRNLEDELKRIGDFFEGLNIDELEKIADECGVGVIEPSYSSSYTVPKARYSNKDKKTSRGIDKSKFNVKNSNEGLEAA